GHIARAALEAMGYQTRDVLEAMRKDSGLRIMDLKVDGGAVANDLLLQLQSNILGIRVTRPKVIETTSLGAAYLAGLAVGYWRSGREIKRCWKKDRVFTPRLPASEREKLYAGWKNAVERTLT
ncbi:MAG: glycerol kinase, partial [Candidatus Omnitrophica bacterium]|nr:glycerol kinase [Candidatus Omnitrophota bacterium]